MLHDLTKSINNIETKKRTTPHYLNPPVQHASTVVFSTIDELREAQNNPIDHLPYARAGSALTREFESIIAEMEGGYGAISTPSGLSAITLVLMQFLSQGDHLLVSDCVYPSTRGLFDNIIKKFGVEVSFFDPALHANITELIKENTKIIYVESPGSLTFEVMDIEAISKAAKSVRDDILILTDNTWATPIFYKPFEDGVDISIHAATKYLSGHSDLMLGVIACKDKKHYETLRSAVMSTGICPGQDDIYLAMRGLKSLGLRMAQHYENGLKLARWCSDNPYISKILHPAQPDCEGHQIWLDKFSGAGSLFSIVFNKEIQQNQIDKAINSCKVFRIGLSWGGFDSLVVPADINFRKYSNIPEGRVLRLYSGLEPIQSQIADLEQAFHQL